MSSPQPGTVPYAVLLYSVSEPGIWRADDIADDLPDASPDEVNSAVDDLAASGLIHRNSTDQRLWPLRPGRELIQRHHAPV